MDDASKQKYFALAFEIFDKVFRRRNNFKKKNPGCKSALIGKRDSYSQDNCSSLDIFLILSAKNFANVLKQINIIFPRPYFFQKCGINPTFYESFLLFLFSIVRKNCEIYVR